MIALPPGARVWLAAGTTYVRDFDGLAFQVQEVLQLDPFSGHLFVFRGRRGDLLKCLFWGLRRLVSTRYFCPSALSRRSTGGPGQGTNIWTLSNLIRNGTIELVRAHGVTETEGGKFHDLKYRAS